MLSVKPRLSFSKFNCKYTIKLFVAAVITDKPSVRKNIKNRLSLIPLEQKLLKSEEVVNKLFALPAFQESSRISVYLSTENEISTEPIVRKIFEQGKLCFVPRYNGKVMEMVKLDSMQDWEDLPLTKWNIKQPKLSEIRENAVESGGLDLVILPGVAFTASGDRLGHGKGYYDSFLHQIFKSQTVPPSTVALAFREQVLDMVPIHEHDVKIDVVLYPN